MSVPIDPEKVRALLLDGAEKMARAGVDALARGANSSQNRADGMALIKASAEAYTAAMLREPAIKSPFARSLAVLRRAACALHRACRR